MEANVQLRSRLSSAASTALEDVNIANNGLLSSIECKVSFPHFIFHTELQTKNTCYL